MATETKPVEAEKKEPEKKEQKKKKGRRDPFGSCFHTKLF